MSENDVLEGEAQGASASREGGEVQDANASREGGVSASVNVGADAGNENHAGAGHSGSEAQDARASREGGEVLLEVERLVCGYGSHEVVHGASFDVRRGEFCCIIGANGCGKSTLLKNILCLDKPFSGTVRMQGRDVGRMHDAERARTFAYLPQAHTPPFPFTVADVVLMGRSPYLDRLSRIGEEDRQIAWDALVLLGIEHLAAEDYTQLSGGQRQLVLIARCLAQQPDLIIMDEPTASLDFGNQQVVLSRMRELTRTGVSVLMVTHDPAHAFYCADRVVVMRDGAIEAIGTPQAVMTRERLERIYSTPLDVIGVHLRNGRDATVCVAL